MPMFYDHPKTGKLHFSAAAGGYGGGATSFYDAPATEADIKAHHGPYGTYLVAKRKAEAEASEKAEVVEKVEAAAEAVSEVLAHQSVPHGGE